MPLQVLAVYQPRDFESAVDMARRGEAGALLVLPALLFERHHSRLAGLVSSRRLPVI